ncbi:phosphotransferase [Streptomyces sp. NBC_01310]|uniref:phosphotransferase enzyme family protein n=1 Tax=Streptomyces sp. NBC_01310 TaxID=2903820 RepID=UPI0035B65AF3|nr:phosphotransferase [Streptomyces sp. NBC_01310]
MTLVSEALVSLPEEPLPVTVTAIVDQHVDPVLTAHSAGTRDDQVPAGDVLDKEEIAAGLSRGPYVTPCRNALLSSVRPPHCRKGCDVEPSAREPVAQEQIMAVTGTLVRAYGLHPAQIARIPQGTSTDNYAIVDQTGPRYFAKVYRARDRLDPERASVELSEYAADGGVATARATRTREHELLETHGRLPMSLWWYVPHTETAEGNLTGARWAAVGTAMGRLHRRLATHPAAAPTLEPGTAVCDVAASRDRFESLIRAFQHRPRLGEFETWALQAALERQALWGDIERTLASLPQLTVQVLHGDLAGPNVLLKNDEVAAFVDFRPRSTPRAPSPRRYGPG